jgi:hypothetical protein
MDNIMTFAWYAPGREVYWLPNHRINAHIVEGQVFRRWENFKTGARSAVVRAGHMSLKMHHPSDKYQYATRK